MLKRQQHMAPSPQSTVDGVRGPSAGVMWCVDKPDSGNMTAAASSTPRPATAAAADRWRVNRHAQSGAQTESNHRVKSRPSGQEDAGIHLHLQLEALQLSYSLRKYKLGDKDRSATRRSKEAPAEERSVGATRQQKGKTPFTQLAPPRAKRGLFAAAASLPAASLAAATGKRNN